jgi:hypothetical protein
VADQNHAATFFCGGSRNADRFIDVWDGVFVLEIDLDTLNRRLAARPKDAWGGSASEGEQSSLMPRHPSHASWTPFLNMPTWCRLKNREIGVPAKVGALGRLTYAQCLRCPG